MINQQFMNALAQLESVSATDAEKAAINSVRGRYVAAFGTDNQMVQNFAKLEAVAVTEAERNEINTIRGKFGLMEMTLNIDNNDISATVDNLRNNYTSRGVPIDQLHRIRTQTNSDESFNANDRDWDTFIDPERMMLDSPYEDEPENNNTTSNDDENTDKLVDALIAMD